MTKLLYAVRVLSVVLLVSGVFALLTPRSVADFAGLQVEPDSTNGCVEIGAAYGGVPIALGAIALYATTGYAAASGAMLAAVGLVFAGATLGRLVVIVSMGPTTLVGWLLLLFDAVSAVVFLVGSRVVDAEL